MTDNSTSRFIGVSRLSGVGSTITWRFVEPVLVGETSAPHTAVHVEAPAKLSALEAYLYAAAKRQETEKGVWGKL